MACLGTPVGSKAIFRNAASAAFGLRALPLRRAAALVVQPEIARREPPLDRATDRRTPAPAVRIAAARAVARIVDSLHDAALHGLHRLRLGVVLRVRGAPEDPAEDADDPERHDGGGEDDQVQHRRPRAEQHREARVRKEGKGPGAAAPGPFEQGVGGFGERPVTPEAAAPSRRDPELPLTTVSVR